jgi:disulfide bond formation protein DsbB
MINLINIVNKTLAVGVIGSQVFILLVIIYAFLPKKIEKINNFFGKNGIKLAFLVSLVAIAGSLFYSSYAGYTPCVLCWYQRIFMYPEVLILGLALYRKENHIVDYSLALAVAGLVISIYHNYIYFKGLHSTVCTTAESCITPYVSEFGYITIPMMALTAFLLIILFLIFKKVYGKTI